MDKLRKALLFQVHPDYFHSNPIAKKQNEDSLRMLLNLNLTRKDPIVLSLNAKNGRSVADKKINPFEFKDKHNWLRMTKRRRELELGKGWILAMESLCKDLNILLPEIPEIEEARNRIAKELEPPKPQKREKFSSILNANKLDSSILRARVKKT